MGISELEELKQYFEKQPYFDRQKFNEGLDLARETTKNWNNQTNPGKVFIKGRRVHHGTAGFALVPIGMINRDSQILGVAYGLMEDDIDDIDDWFKFEKGGDPKSIFSIE